MNNDWQAVFAKDASLFPHLADLQKDQLLLSTMSEAAFNQASFLDQRLFTPDLQRQIVSWADIASISLPTLPKPQYIFHVGHVGSTLISRLLGELDNVMALREPALLRQLADVHVTMPADVGWTADEQAERLGQAEHWLSRVFHAEQRVMIKASSFVSPLAQYLLAMRAQRCSCPHRSSVICRPYWPGMHRNRKRRRWPTSGYCGLRGIVVRLWPVKRRFRLPRPPPWDGCARWSPFVTRRHVVPGQASRGWILMIF